MSILLDGDLAGMLRQGKAPNPKLQAPEKLQKSSLKFRYGHLNSWLDARVQKQDMIDYHA